MVVVRNVISFVGNLFTRAKWSSNLCGDISRSALYCTTKADIPVPPKRPPTAYMIFCKENRPLVLKDNPDVKGTELIKMLAEKWAALTPTMKMQYEETARENTIVYGKLHKDFYENLTEEQRDALHKLKVEKRESKRVQKLKKALKGSGLPTYIRNAYTIFVQSKAKEIGTIKNGPAFIKQVAEEWKFLSEEQKKVFYEKAKEEKCRFESEMTEWRKKLAVEGRADLLKSYEEGKYRHRVPTPATTVSIKKTVSSKSVEKMDKPKN